MPLKNGRTSASLQTTLVGSVIPAGTIAPFGGGTVPDGWLLCNGSTISRLTYSALFLAISTTYGSGDGLSTFTLPNTQGVFLRGAGSQTISAVSYSATRGATQGDSIQTHEHTINYNSATSGGGSNLAGFSSVSTAFTKSTTGGGSGRTSTETRPANIGVNYIIKL
jgi:microcystin-dependent protein